MTRPGSPDIEQQPADGVEVPASDARPPKQRFKETAHDAAVDAATAQQADRKRPLAELLDEAEERIVAVAEGKSPVPASPNGRPRPDEAARKRPHQTASLIRNVAQPHKPRIGPGYQADLPALQPRG